MKILSCVAVTCFKENRMKLSLTPVNIPFMVGDTVWVDQPFGAVNQFPYFQGMIMQIILDGGLANSLVIRERAEVHELIVSSAVYGMKPVGMHAGMPRVIVNVQLSPFIQTLFENEQVLLDHQNRIGLN